MIELGDKAKDRITGFTGIVVARTDWLNQCRRYAVQPEKLDKDGKPLEVQWFDEPQLDVVKRQVHRPIVLVQALAPRTVRVPVTGGPQRSAPVSRDPRR